MKKIVYLFFLLCFTLFSKAQDTIFICGDSVSITVSRISCHADSGFINIDYINQSSTYTYEWYDSNWISTNIFTEDYADTSCGVYTLIIFDNTSSACDTISRFVKS